MGKKIFMTQEFSKMQLQRSLSSFCGKKRKAVPSYTCTRNFECIPGINVTAPYKTEIIPYLTEIPVRKQKYFNL